MSWSPYGCIAIFPSFFCKWNEMERVDPTVGCCKHAKRYFPCCAKKARQGNTHVILWNLTLFGLFIKFQYELNHLPPRGTSYQRSVSFLFLCQSERNWKTKNGELHESQQRSPTSMEREHLWQLTHKYIIATYLHVPMVPPISTGWPVN